MGRGFSRGFNSGFLHAAETVFSALEAEDTATFSATLLDNAVLDATEAADVVSFEIESGVADTVTAVLDATEAPDIALFAATIVETVVEKPHGGSGSSSGAVILPPEHPDISLVFSAREEPDRARMSARARARNLLSLRNVEQSDVARFKAKVAHRGRLSMVEAPDRVEAKADLFDMQARNRALLLMAA